MAYALTTLKGNRQTFNVGDEVPDELVTDDMKERGLVGTKNDVNKLSKSDANIEAAQAELDAAVAERDAEIEALRSQVAALEAEKAAATEPQVQDNTPKTVGN